MTVAVCTQCGNMKLGALTPCDKCSFDPEENEDKAKAMVLTDHFFSKEDLEGISHRLQEGKPVTYPEEAIEEYVRMFEENPDLGKTGWVFKLGCALFLALLIGGMAYLLGAFS